MSVAGDVDIDARRYTLYMLHATRYALHNTHYTRHTTDCRRALSLSLYFSLALNAQIYDA